MSDKTTNYNFDTPGLDGAANIEVQDANWEKADTALAAKVDKISGKGLSTNDFTSTYKTKLDNLDTNLAAKAPAYSYGTTDLTAGTSALATGKLYFVYE